MKNHTALVLLSALLFSAPAFADTTPSDVSSDVGAVQKDNAAMAHDNYDLATDRTAKARDKATGNWSGQAMDSVNIGADKAMHTEKSSEKSTDQDIMNHDVNNATQQ